MHGVKLKCGLMHRHATLNQIANADVVCREVGLQILEQCLAVVVSCPDLFEYVYGLERVLHVILNLGAFSGKLEEALGDSKAESGRSAGEYDRVPEVESGPGDEGAQEQLLDPGR